MELLEAWIRVIDVLRLRTGYRLYWLFFLFLPFPFPQVDIENHSAYRFVRPRLRKKKKKEKNEEKSGEVWREGKQEGRDRGIIMVGAVQRPSS